MSRCRGRTGEAVAAADVVHVSEHVGTVASRPAAGAAPRIQRPWCQAGAKRGQSTTYHPHVPSHGGLVSLLDGVRLIRPCWLRPWCVTIKRFWTCTGGRSESSEVPKSLRDGRPSLRRARVDPCGAVTVVSRPEREAAQFLDMGDPAGPWAEAVTGGHVRANVPIRGGALGPPSDRGR